MTDARIHSSWSASSTIDHSDDMYHSLTLWPQGRYKGTEIQISRPSKMPLSELLIVADRVLATAQAWRNGIAEAVEKKRTVEDELAEARAELARLRGTDGGDS